MYYQYCMGSAEKIPENFYILTWLLSNSFDGNDLGPSVIGSISLVLAPTGLTWIERKKWSTLRDNSHGVVSQQNNMFPFLRFKMFYKRGQRIGGIHPDLSEVIHGLC